MVMIGLANFAQSVSAWKKPLFLIYGITRQTEENIKIWMKANGFLGIIEFFLFSFVSITVNCSSP